MTTTIRVLDLQEQKAVSASAAFTNSGGGGGGGVANKA